MRQLIKAAVRDSKKDMPELTEGMLRRAIRERAKRQKIAKRKGIKPGSRRWRDLVRDTTKRRKKK
jgi:hypothetical protein